MATIIGLAISNPTIKTAGYLPVRMLTFCEAPHLQISDLFVILELLICTS